MKHKKKLIGLTGKARSGKDTAGKILMVSQGFHRMAFADPLKHAMAATFGVDVAEFHCDELKDQLHAGWGLTRRAMLQQGADALREKFDKALCGAFGQAQPGSGLFVKRWVNDYLAVADQEHVVVTDVRSDAEAAAIRDFGGVVLNVVRLGAGLKGEAGAHHTESGISSHLLDGTLHNNGSIHDLKLQLLLLTGSQP